MSSVPEMRLRGIYVPTQTRNRVLIDLDAAFGTALRDAVHLVDALARYLGENSEAMVTGTQLVLLNRLLFEDNSTRLRDLAKSMHVSSHTMTQHIQRLKLQGLIDRTADDEDKRGVLVRISESGERVARAAHAIRRATLQTAFSIGRWTIQNWLRVFLALHRSYRVSAAAGSRRANRQGTHRDDQTSRDSGD